MARSSYGAWAAVGSAAAVSGAFYTITTPGWMGDPFANVGAFAPPLGWVLLLHGVGGNGKDGGQGITWGPVIQRLADEGYGVFAPDLIDWPSDLAIARVDAAYATLKAHDGRTTPPLCILGNSDGSGEGLVWLKTNSAKVTRAYLNNPGTDYRYAYNLGGYTPAYDPGSVAAGGFTTAMNAASAFGGNWGTWTGSHAGYRVNDEPASWRGLSTKIVLDQASDDAQLPPNAASWFAGQVNDPNVVMRSSARTGGHTNTATLPPADVISFLRWGIVP